MKKLMVILAVVAASVAANAATVDWNYQITGEAGGSATEFTGYTAYLVDATYYSGLSAVTAESITGTGNYLQKATLAQTGSSGKGTSKKYIFSTNAQGYSSDSLNSGTSYSYYLVLVDTAGENYVASAYNYTARDATSAYNADDIKLALDSSAIASGMKAFSDAPEPTSALLLMFGVAGLALKRKRA